MSTVHASVRNAARLAYKALHTSLAPANDLEYRELLALYRADPGFAAQVQDDAAGLELVILDASERGLIVAPASRESRFAVRMADIRLGLSAEQKAALLLAHVAVAAAFFPTTDALDDYGAGEAFRSSGAALGQVLREVRASGAEYLGDLDPRGLRIPMEFNRAALPAGPQVAPALPAYRWLLDHGRTRDKAQCADADVDVACRWLDPDLGQRLAALWRAGQWIPQEALGYEQLMAGLMTPPCSIPG